MPQQENQPSGVPQLRDLRSKIEGLLPKNTQTRVLGGLSILMIAIIGFSGRSGPKEQPPAPTPVSITSMDTNRERIQAYRAQIEEQARKLAAEQAQLAQTKQALGVAANTPAPGSGVSEMDRRALMAASPDYSPRYVEEDPFKLERKKREYQSLFASNIALSHRPIPQPGQLRLKDDFESPSAAKKSDSETRKMYRLDEGTVIETTLVNRLDGSFSGPIKCMVTTNVYSHDRRKLLIPQGTRMLGEVQRVEAFGQQRLSVAFHRMIMPNQFSVDLDQFKGLNQIGETGLIDQVNRHYLQIFGAAIAIGALGGLSQSSTRYGVEESGLDAYRQGVATNLSQSSLRILDRFLNVLPTLTIQEGYRIKVYLSADLMLPAYEEHGPSDE